jgi:hypothetical protein
MAQSGPKEAPPVILYQASLKYSPSISSKVEVSIIGVSGILILGT